MIKFNSVTLTLLIGGEAQLLSQSHSRARVVYSPHHYEQAVASLAACNVIDGFWEGVEPRVFRLESKPARWSEGKILLDLGIDPNFPIKD